MISQRRTQILTIIAKDPNVTLQQSVRPTHKILTTQIEIPAEDLAPGPRGSRVQVIDYDASTGRLYPPLRYRPLESGTYNDPFTGEPDETLLGEPSFHAQNVYAIVMRVLARFEFALGRRVDWSFDGHQINVAPHAFAEPNAFYSRHDRALMFGYFPSRMKQPEGQAPESRLSTGREMVFTCLSHDIIVHETTHALLDGLRDRYTDPSSPEQAGFHEGFADVVALLSIFSLSAVVEEMIDRTAQRPSPIVDAPPPAIFGPGQDEIQRSLIAIDKLEPDALRQSLLFGLGDQIGAELDVGRGTELRRSVNLKPEDVNLDSEEYKEPHRRGEVLVAAMMSAFISIWRKRIETLGFKTERKSNSKISAELSSGSLPEPIDEKRRPKEYLDRQRVVEEGATIADHLLTISIRAIDYCPPTDLEFCDFLSALLTSDREIRPDDSKYHFRAALRESFAAYKIRPTSKSGGTEEGIWEHPEVNLLYDRAHFGSMLSDHEEMFRFIWENRLALGLEEDAYTRVLSVRPCVRINADDGFVLRETVAEYYQILILEASELKHFGIKTPIGMPASQEITLYGGGALIFDEFGRVKFHIRNRILNPERQTRRLQHLWDYGHFTDRRPSASGTADRRFSEMHQQRLTSLRFSIGAESHDAF